MCPVYYKLPNGFELRTYGLLLVIGVLVAVRLARSRASKFGLEPNAIWDAVPWLLLPGVLGARVLYIVQHWSYYSGRSNEIFSLRFDGLTSFGGLIGGFIGFLVWKRRSKVSTKAFLDATGVPVLVAQAIGRIGCLLNGCCYGRPTEEWYGVHVEGLHEVHVPAQLLDFVLMLVAAGLVCHWERKPRRPGQSFGLAMVGYGLSRFAYEFLRAGTAEEFDRRIVSSKVIASIGLTSAQLGALAMVAVGLVFVCKVGKK